MKIDSNGFYRCKQFTLRSVMFPSLYDNIDISYETYFINPSDDESDEIFIMDDKFENQYVAKWWYYENICGLRLHKEWVDCNYEGIYDLELVQIISYDLTKYNDKTKLTFELSNYPIEYNWY